MEGQYQIWIQHFINQAKGLVPHQKAFYKVGSQRGEGKPVIQLVTPTEQVVERAKASLKEKNDTYDPVTGVVHQSVSSLLRGKNSSKRKKKSRPGSSSKAGKKSLANQGKRTKIPKRKNTLTNRNRIARPWLL